MASARSAEATYAQHLVHVTLPGGADNVIIASYFATLDKKADADDRSVLETGKPIQELNKARTRFAVELQMKTATGAVESGTRAFGSLPTNRTRGGAPPAAVR